ncbi:MAG: YlxR family protein [Actinomycetota bacterium]
MRTCIGCRQRAAAAELLRVVAAPAASTAGSSTVQVVPDPRRRVPGRGAWLHPGPRCVDLAERRRAFSRALRVPGLSDVSPVRDFLASLLALDDRHDSHQGGSPPDSSRTR